MDRADCTLYNDANCPKGMDLTNIINKDTLDFVTFGCWGVYCLDGEVNLEKGKKIYGGLRVVKGLEEFAKIQPLDFVTLTGDNIYSRPLEETESEYTARPQFDIDRHLVDGFSNCFKDVNVEKFFVGIGNHDIETCDVINAQLRYDDPRWRMPGTYYSVVHKTNNFNIRMIFMDTNLYSAKQPFCRKSKVDHEIAKKIQLDWLIAQMAIARINSEMIILAGHIPIECNNHKFKRQFFNVAGGGWGNDRLNLIQEPHLVETDSSEFDIEDLRWTTHSPELEKDISKLHKEYYIALYICADTHNKQLIQGNNELPIQLICGTGGTSLDTVKPDKRTDIGKRTIFSKKSYGFSHISINKYKDIQIDVYQTTPQDLKLEFSHVILNENTHEESSSRSRSDEVYNIHTRTPARANSSIR